MVSKVEDSEQSTSVCEDSKQKTVISSMTRKEEILFIFVLFYGMLTEGACYSLQAPFFPKIAEEKGVSPAIYGFIFGILETTMIFTSPIFGKLVAYKSCNILMQFGLACAGLSVVAFGLTVYIPSGYLFIVVCFIIRIINGIGVSANSTASYSAIAEQFPTKTAMVFGILEVAFALGSTLGPTFGGFLYETGGFSFPFITLGFVLFSAAFVNLYFSPKIGTPEVRQKVALTEFLADFDTLVDFLGVCIAFMDVGLLNVLLEPHLRVFDLKPTLVGLSFVCLGLSYAISSPIIGWIIDHGIPPKVMNIICCPIILIAASFIGPIPSINIRPQIWIIIPCLVCIGFGEAGRVLCGFISAKKDAIKRRGYLENIETYGMITSAYLSCTSLGLAIGPSIGGLILAAVGPRGTTSFIVGLNIFMSILLSISLTRYYRQESAKKLDKTSYEIFSN